MNQAATRLRGNRVGIPTRAASAFVVALLSVLAVAGTASAHAQLEGSDPPAGAVLAAPPSVVTLSFGEPAEVNDGAIEVFDDRFNQVDVGHVTAVGADSSRLRVALAPNLPKGTYTVSWHVSSADTHPVAGSFVFSVGAATVVRGTVPGSGAGDAAGVALGVLRWMGYLGLVLGPGVLMVALWLWPSAVADRGVRRLAVTGLVLLVLSTVGGMALQGVWASGRSISALWTDPGSLDTHSRKFDEVYAVRSYLVIGFAVALVAALSAQADNRRGNRSLSSARRLLLGATVASTVALVSTWPVVGHSAAGSMSLVGVPVNVLHTLAMTIWLGGLVLILVGLRAAERADQLMAVLPHFSRLALAAVGTLVVTGSFLAWKEVGSWNALTATTFGRVLSLKLLGAATLLLLGNVARRWVQRHLSVPRTPPPAPSKRTAQSVEIYGPAVARLRVGVVAEVGVAAAVLALTAALVVIVPARQDVQPPGDKAVRQSVVDVGRQGR